MGTPTIGEIRMFGGTFEPRGFATCDGRLLSIAENTALFSILGTTYGGNGQTTFGVPDLRGRFPMHAGTGPGLSNRALGEAGGTESVTMATAQMPSHQHSYSANVTPAGRGDAGSLDAPATAIFAGSATDENYAPLASANGTMAPIVLAGPTGPTGGGQPVSVMQPMLAINFIIALEGIFPSRS